MQNLIVFKTNSFPNISETFIVSNITETIKRGYDVKIIVDEINPKTNTSQPDLLEQYGLMDRTLKFNQPTQKLKRKIKAIYLLLNPFLFYYYIKYSLYKGKKSLDTLFILNFYWEYRNARAFHIHFATAINPLFELKKIGFLKSKIVVTFHGYDAHCLPKGDHLKNLIVNFNDYVVHITVNSQFLKNKLVAQGFMPSKITIVPIGIDATFFKRNVDLIDSKTTLKLITVGRLVALKGHEYGLRAVKALVNKGFIVHYTIVGDGDQLAHLMDLAKHLEIGVNVSFLGSRNQNEIKELLQVNHLFLMPSTVDGSDRREAFGVVSLEAQALGLPVVGFQSGGFPETVVEGITGFIVEDQNVTAVVNAIVKFIFDKNLLINMGINARNHILSTFTFEKTTEQYLKLYE